MYKVYYWERDRIVGEYLEHRIFDDYNNALLFAKQHKSKVERII